MSTHTGPREWDAEAYHRVSDLQFGWATEVLERLPLRGDERVLDAGCGSGRVTALLADRVPDGRVIAIDASRSMVEKARETVGERAEVRQGDLAELELDRPVEAIFSNAVFHWLPDHARLFARLHAALLPGGRLVAQCGGAGNVAALAAVIVDVAGESRFAEHLADFRGIWNFASAEETSERLRAAGFAEVECWLEPKRVVPDRPLEFLETVSLGPHIARLPEELRRPFVEAVAARMPDPMTLDYVRLNIDARRPD